MGSQRTTDEVLALMKSHGDRLTTSRRAVIDVVLAGDHHVTADEIVSRVAETHPEVHRATVYRTLDRLQEVGVLTHVHLGHGASTFHLNDRPHHHAVCSSCGAVVEVPLSALDDLGHSLHEKHGFELASQHFALSGLCADCVRAGAEP
jgi:Fur family transcriptional regulator, ferric uptake regulator